MIYISNTAQIHFAKLLSKQKVGTNIRVFVTDPGTPYAKCGIAYCPPDSVKPTDTSLKFNQFIVYIDKSSVFYLKNAEIDLVTNSLESQLTIKAPNSKLSRISSTNQTSLTKRIEHLLQSEINPQLARHGGYVSLIEVTDTGHAILQFSGGCNGCSLVRLTLKTKIKERLLSIFPEIKDVIDSTDHQRGLHSYY